MITSKVKFMESVDIRKNKYDEENMNTNEDEEFEYQEKFIKSVINCLKKLLFDLEKVMNLYLSIRPYMRDIKRANISR